VLVTVRVYINMLLSILCDVGSIDCETVTTFHVGRMIVTAFGF